MSETQLPPLVVNAGTLALLKLEPANPTARALVLKQVGKPVPDDCVEYDAIVKWIAENQTVPVVRSSPTVLKASVSASAYVTGRCRYAGNVSNRAELQLSEAEIVNLAKSSNNDTEFFEAIESAFRDKASEMELFPEEDYEYDGHEEQDRDDFNYEFNHTTVFGLAANILKDAAPEVYSDLFAF